MKHLVVAMLVGFSVACQSAASAPNDPVWGKQACSSCAMLISDPRFAAQLLTVAGDPLYFDDVGCMAAFLARRKVAVQGAWVRDTKGTWLATDLARFSKGARTPMDYGFEFSETGQLSWGEVRDAVRESLARESER